MLHAIDVANFFIDMSNANIELEDFMTNLRVNKLSRRISSSKVA